MLAIFSAYIAFLVSGRIRTSTHREYSLPWLLAGAFALGGGVWAMHFIGMLSYKLPTSINYDALVTVLSVIPAIFASLIVLRTTHKQYITGHTLLWRSVLMGGGIGLMHYIGMMAMSLDGIIRYDFGLLVFSILVAMMLAGVSLWFKLQADKHVTAGVLFSFKLLIPSIVMGCAISGMHYIGMAAMYVFPGSSVNLQAITWSPDELARIISSVVILLGILLIVAIEVSHRLDLYQRIRDSESQVRLLLDSTAEAIYGIDTHGNCSFANQACLDMLGYESITELLGCNMYDLSHHSYPDGSPCPVEKSQIYRSLSEQIEIHVDDEVLWRKDHSNFRAEYWSHPINKKGKFVGAVVTFLEITDRVEAHEALQEREQDLAITLNSIGDAVITTDAEGKITRMNPVAERLTGWSFQEAQGQLLKTVFPIRHTSTREPLESPVDKVTATGETIFLSNHTTLIAKDGTEYQIADSAAPIRNHDKIIGIVLVFNDVTEQYNLRQTAAKSKRNLQAIMDNSPAVIYVKDTDGRFTFVNKRFENLFHTQQKDIVGKNLHDIFPKDIADTMRRNDQMVLDAGQALESEEIAPHDGDLHTYVSVKFPLFNENNNIYGICGISTDISDRRQQEELLRRTQKMDALGKLTGGIAHDYNNLLGIIQGYAEQLNEHLSGDAKLSKYTNDIQHAAERGAKLTKKLLAFSRHNAPNSTVVNISTLLHEQQHMLEKTLTVRFKLVMDLEDDLWLVDLDSNDLEDAIVNMSINAMHAMEMGGEITLRTSNARLNEIDAQQLNLNVGDYVLLSITDTGNGMDEITKESIFDPFYTTKGDRGTGLGLSQVYGFVERSGGVIKVYSEFGHGSRFALYFPRSHQTITEVEKPTIENTRKLRGSETLLIVDDEKAMVELARDIFTAQGYEVLTANDGEQALAVLEKQSVDLVISDVIMPNMDGYQLTAQIQKRYPHTKIQLVSGFADDRHRTMVDKTLHKNMLHKPYTTNKLLAQVRSLFDEKTPKDILLGRTILVVDDEKAIRKLFEINLQKLGCEAISTNNGDEAISLYQNSMTVGDPIDVVITDLSIPGSLDGKMIAEKIHYLDKNAKVIVSSGSSQGPEMTHYQDHGFQGALEKNFKREYMKQVLEQVLLES